MVLHCAHLIRRARWFCLLSESSLAWSSAEDRDNFNRLVVFNKASVIKQETVKTGEKIPIPPGYKKSFRTRQKGMNLIAYDRLRVVTTELRRLVSQDRDVQLRFGPGVTLWQPQINNVLQWV
jgi:hypothetical protein